MNAKPTISILGAGESGVGAALLAQYMGYEVFVSDAGIIAPKYQAQLQAAGIAFEEGKHTAETILKAQEIIKSPGIDPKKNEVLIAAKKKKISVIGEIEFAGRYTQAKIIGITGTNGKTTTTLLTHHLLKESGLNVRLAGNVGNSFAAQVLEELQKGNVDLIYVLELSSFMLDDMYQFKVDIGILTNITPDHLDRYQYKVENYVASKFRLVQNMDESSTFIYGIDSELVEEALFEIETLAQELPFSTLPDEFDGACGDEETILLQINNQEIEIDLSHATLKGKHHVYNMMAASLAATVVGVSKENIEKALANFQNAPHRMENVGVLQEMTFVNDSKATNVDAAWYALDAMQTPVVWIAGGVDKGNDYEALVELVQEKVHTLICLGKDNEKLVKAFSKHVSNVIEVQSMQEVLKASLQFGKSCDTVLLSPCCASFDLFKNYEDRGNQFREVVQVSIQSKSSVLIP